MNDAPRDSPTADPLFDVLDAILRSRGHVVLVAGEGLGEHLGFCVQRAGIAAVDITATPGERRASLLHELLHVRHPDAPEDEIENLTAAALVPWPAAAKARTAAQQQRLADQLGVDRELIAARRRGMQGRRAAG